MRKNILSALIISAALSMGTPAGMMLTSYAAEQTVEESAVDTAETDDTEDLIHEASRLDENGNVTIDVYLKEGTTTPLNITLAKDGTDFSFTVNNSGDPLKIKPGTYKVEKVVDGNGKKLDSGAMLSVEEDTEGVYLDFEDPNKDSKMSLRRFIVRNIMFIPFCALCVLVVKKVASNLTA